MNNLKVITTEELIRKFQQALDEKWGYIYGTKHVMWNAERQAEYDKENKDDPNCQNSIQYGSRWYGHYVTDCSGLFAWAFSVLGGEIYHGSNTMYLKWCNDKGELKKGKRSDGRELKPGTAVFVWNGTKYSHVGLFIGDGIVIEAASTLKGVITSKVSDSKWSHWGELKGVAYYEKTITDVEPAKDDSWPTLRKGSKGEYVRKLQQLLLDHGYSLPKYGADGDFGSETQAAVKQFQRDWGLKVDGIVGPQTLKMLKSSPAKEKLYAVTIINLTEARAKELMDKYPGSYMEEERG
jgi:hypothetical protein